MPVEEQEGEEGRPTEAGRGNQRQEEPEQRVQGGQQRQRPPIKDPPEPEQRVQGGQHRQRPLIKDPPEPEQRVKAANTTRGHSSRLSPKGREEPLTKEQPRRSGQGERK